MVIDFTLCSPLNLINSLLCLILDLYQHLPKNSERNPGIVMQLHIMHLYMYMYVSEYVEYILSHWACPLLECSVNYENLATYPISM